MIRLYEKFENIKFGTGKDKLVIHFKAQACRNVSYVVA